MMFKKLFPPVCVQKLYFACFVLFLLLLAACIPSDQEGTDEDLPPPVKEGVPEKDDTLTVPSPRTVKEGEVTSVPVESQGVVGPKKVAHPCPECVAERPVVTEDSALSAQASVERPGFVCSYPSFLKEALGKALHKTCADIKEVDIQSLTFLHLHLPAEFSSSLPPAPFRHFKSIQVLDLSDNPSLEQLPDFVTELSSLVKLDISATGIQDLDSQICKMDKLQILIAGGNTYKDNEPPRSLFCLKNLRVLDLSHSHLIYIDEEIFNLWELRELYLQNNRLVTEPAVLSYMPHLDVIDLTGNLIKNADGVLSLEMNRLHTCLLQPGESKQDCKNDLRYHLRCRGGWRRPFPYKRKEPFREMFKEYHNMNEGEYQEFLKSPQHNRCYMYWLNTEIGDACSDPNSPLLEKTINGKTIREWRLLHEIIRAWWHVHNRPSDYLDAQMCFFEKYGGFWKGVWGSFMGSMDFSHLPLSVEKHTERFLDPTMQKPPLKDCPGLKGR